MTYSLQVASLVVLTAVSAATARAEEKAVVGLKLKRLYPKIKT